MEDLSLRYKQLEKAYKRLEYMTKKFVELSQQHSKDISVKENEENELIAHRDALIQRFEFCYDLTWKFFKQLLREKFSIDATSPRRVFQECFQQKILTNEESKKLIEMIDSRNQTSHVYDEATADDVSKKIVTYYPLLALIVKQNQPK